MKEVLDDLVQIDGVLGGLLVSKDGLIVASTLLDDEDSDVLGAMAATMFATISRASERIGLGALQSSIVEAAHGAIQMFEAQDLILVVIAESSVNLGMVRIEMRKAARRVREAIPM